MDAYDCEIADKQMSKKVEAIFGDPTRHKFYSCYDAYIAENIIGRRGGKIRRKKLECFHCGQKKKVHTALETEYL